MGREFDVSVWNSVNASYEHRWSGDTLVEALVQMQKLKEEGYGCIRLEWRPE